MRAMDVMTTDVITVDPDMTVQALARLLAERGISGARIVDSNGRLVGIISEGDLLHRAEIGTARRHRNRRRSWWLDHFASGRTVKDIMTRDDDPVPVEPQHWKICLFSTGTHAAGGRQAFSPASMTGSSLHAPLFAA
jgi:CBS-domain-containing membrane protein